jgi:hypothetical protein
MANLKRLLLGLALSLGATACKTQDSDVLATETGAPAPTPSNAASDLESTFSAQSARDADRAEFLELFTRARSMLPAR